MACGAGIRSSCDEFCTSNAAGVFFICTFSPVMNHSYSRLLLKTSLLRWTLRGTFINAYSVPLFGWDSTKSQRQMWALPRKCQTELKEQREKIYE